MSKKYFLYSIAIHIFLIIILMIVRCPYKNKSEMIKLNVTYKILKNKKTPNDKYKSVSKNNNYPVEEVKKRNTSSLKQIPKKVNSYSDDIEDDLNSNITEFDDKEPEPIRKTNKRIYSNDISKNKSDTEIPIPGAKKIVDPIDNKIKEKGDFFKIEGDLQNRIIVNKPIPKSVNNLSEEIELKFQMVVDGNGNVTEIIPIKKAHFEAEKNSMEALKKWKFNALPKTERHRIQKGVITIYFKIN